MISVEEFILRRSKIAEDLEEGSCLILFAGVPKKRSEDEDYDFSINRNFYYLTNIEQDESILMIKKEGGVVNETLFISEFDEVKEKWTGKRLTAKEARDLSGIQNVLFINQFEVSLESLYKDKNLIRVYIDLDPELKIGPSFTTHEFMKVINQKSKLKVLDAYNLVAKLRIYKSEAEINEFKEAIHTTNLGLEALMRKLKGGLYEYQLSSLFYYTVQDHNFSELSFPTIAAGGVNATCLHYATPLSKINDGDLILFDLGARNNYYNADISRTYPINGKFNSLQKKIYQIVLDANKLVIKTAKPGVSIKELNDLVTNFMAEECLKLKLIHSKEEIKNYYFHSCSHYIGLDTHDISLKSDTRYSYLPLEKGMVISDEPGLYFKELGIGVRIEDDLLITENGCINLSEEIIKEVEDIEKFMGGRK